MTTSARPSERPWVAIQRNPRSGSGKSRGELRSLASRLKQHGFHVRMLADRERLEHIVRDAARPPVAIVAAGGDGTVGSVANRFPGLPIAILPLGTENLLARYLGIRCDGTVLADLIAAQKTLRLDTATVNGARMLIVAGFGVDGEVVRRLDSIRTGTISHLTYLKPILSAFRTYHYTPIRVFVDDQPEPLVGSQVMVVNLPAYAMRMPFAVEATGEDGLLDIRVFGKGSTFQMVKYCYKVLRRQHEKMPDVYCAQAKTVRVESDVPVPAQIDGDPAGTTPASIRIEPATIEFVVP